MDAYHLNFCTGSRKLHLLRIASSKVKGLSSSFFMDEHKEMERWCQYFDKHSKIRTVRLWILLNSTPNSSESFPYVMPVPWLRDHHHCSRIGDPPLTQGNIGTPVATSITQKHNFNLSGTNVEFSETWGRACTVAHAFTNLESITLSSGGE